MKFNLSTSRTFYDNADEMQAMAQLGFAFEQHKNKFSQNDKFLIKGDPIVEINTIQELMDLIEKVGAVIVHEGWIEIYNDSRE